MTDDVGAQTARLHELLRGVGVEIALRAGDRNANATVDDDDGPLVDLSDPRARAQAHAILEAGFLVVAADGVLTETESEGLVDAVSALLGPIPRASLARIFNAFGDLLARDGFRERLHQVSTVLQDEETRHAAFVLAMALYITNDAEVPEGAQDVSQAVLTALAGVLDIPPDEVRTLSARWMAETQEVSEDEARTQLALWEVEDPAMERDTADTLVDSLSASMLRAAPRRSGD
ncbi:MAG: hypothetical protein HY909_00045 [Deltaproteobacteria bacterium]|nr:hypothetical protein [Deltaproteobacteria bacterium]